MQLYLDTANLHDIETYAKFGFIDGVTTNPSLLAKEHIPASENQPHLKKITALVSGLVSIEVYALTYEEMVKEGKLYSKIAPNIVIKLPTTEDGLRACKTLTSQGIKTNMTLVFSPTQALLAAKMNATLVSPFVGRIEDAGFDGIELIASIREVFDNYNFPTKILAASFRSIKQITQVAQVGADIATISPALLKAMYTHPFTDSGLEDFIKASHSV
jgi:transaldolase